MLDEKGVADQLNKDMEGMPVVVSTLKNLVYVIYAMGKSADTDSVRLYHPFILIVHGTQDPVGRPKVSFGSMLVLTDSDCVDIKKVDLLFTYEPNRPTQDLYRKAVLDHKLGRLGLVTSKGQPGIIHR